MTLCDTKYRINKCGEATEFSYRIILIPVIRKKTYIPSISLEKMLDLVGLPKEEHREKENW